MKFKQAVKEIVTGKKPLIDVWHYLLGNYRYFFWYWNFNCMESRYFKWLRPLRLHRLIRKHIREQIEYRMRWMDRECFNNGECKKCGCETTKLQMANKPCLKPCYPSMMNRKEWINFVSGKTHVDQNGTWIVYLTQHNKPHLIQQNDRRKRKGKRLPSNKD